MFKIDVRSSSWSPGSAIPAAHTCDGANTSPSLEWDPGPAGTASYALICEDPDAPLGSWTHWTIWNIPSPRLEEAIPPISDLKNGAVQGKNSWSRTGYGGPCPPQGTHRYIFHVYAVDCALSLPPGSDEKRLRAALTGHILAEGELIGSYSRERRRESGTAER